MLSNLRPVSRVIALDSEDECEMDPCFLHSQVIGTEAFGPQRNRKAPLVDLL